jgi:hypothetical protein
MVRYVEHEDPDQAADDVVTRAVDEVLRTAEAWLAWDGRPRLNDGNAWTPHKALRRVADHLLDHLAEIECRLAGLPAPPDRWHGRRITVDSDLARFSEVDLDEATSRLTRLAACYRARLHGLDDATLDAVPDDGWSLRQIVAHVAGITWYAEALSD